ncbi:MAG: phosphatase PAP2 family protein [Thermoleophilia bacterium]
MTSYAQTVNRRLPRGWFHLVSQFAFWLVFYAVYQVVRGVADRNVGSAFLNGLHVIRIEEWSGTLFEPTLQQLVDSSSLLVTATAYTYWLSQFAVVLCTLLWVYFRHHECFAGFRNWLIAANLVGLVCYVIVPTAPPRLFPEWGFIDTLARHSGVNHESGLVALTANPYAAMPSLHSMDSFIVAVVMVGVCRSLLARVLWMIWPVWVWFSVMATGNHYWLDVFAGVVLGVAVGLVLFRRGIFSYWRPARTL